MILFGNSFSPFVRKVLVVAAEKGITLDVQNVGIGDTNPDFRKASPFGKMPALRDGDFAVSDSTAIVTYLDSRFPDHPMLPADPADRARAIWFEEFADTMMSGIVFKCFFNRVVGPLFLKQPGDEAQAVEGETKDLPPLLTYLESVMPDAGGYLVGDSLSIADISVASMLVNYDHARCAVDRAAYPRTFAWAATIHARPSFAPLIAKEQAILARL